MSEYLVQLECGEVEVLSYLPNFTTTVWCSKHRLYEELTEVTAA